VHTLLLCFTLLKHLHGSTTTVESRACPHVVLQGLQDGSLLTAMTTQDEGWVSHLGFTLLVLLLDDTNA
jgi:hypothetical protein